MSEEKKRTTASGRQPETDGAPAPTERRLADGQHADHWVLPAEERAKGFVRPVRRSSVHVGIPGPRYPLRDLTDEEKERYAKYAYVKFEPYPESEAPITGSFWTQERLDKVGRGCGGVTTMGQKIAETYARQPDYYGSTFCASCGGYFPVGAAGEFVWAADPKVRVGT